MNKVHIKSIPRPTATRVSDWANEKGKPLNKTKVGRAFDRFTALYSPKVGGLANYISYNYLTDPKTGEPVLDLEGKKILLQHHLEDKWGKPRGYFSNMPAPKHYQGNGADLGYYYQTTWTLEDGTTILDLSTMHGELGYYVMLASSKVANSETEWRTHKWPSATHYIALQNESDELRYTKAQLKVSAYSALSSLTEVTKLKIAVLLSLVKINSKPTTESVFNVLAEYIEQSTASHNSNIQKFNGLVALLNTKEGKEKLEAMYIIQQALEGGIIREKRDTWTWVRKDGQIITIGNRYNEAVDYILDNKKSSDVEEILSQIKEK